MIHETQFTEKEIIWLQKRKMHAEWRNIESIDSLNFIWKEIAWKDFFLC